MVAELQDRVVESRSEVSPAGTHTQAAIRLHSRIAMARGRGRLAGSEGTERPEVSHRVGGQASVAVAASTEAGRAEVEDAGNFGG